MCAIFAISLFHTIKAILHSLQKNKISTMLCLIIQKLGSELCKRESVISSARDREREREREKASEVTWIKCQEWKIKRRRVTHMTVAHTCKHGAPALVWKRTTYSLKASPNDSSDVCNLDGEKSLYFFFFHPPSRPLPLFVVPHDPASRALRKGRENRSRTPLECHSVL